MFGLGFSKKDGPRLGVDINSDSVTLIQLEKTRAHIDVSRFASSPTPANTVREGLVTDPQTIGAVILELIQEAGIPISGSAPTLNMTIPAQAAVIRLIPVPTGMPAEELAEVVTQEAANHIPYNIQDANLDWSLMPATERTDPDGVRRVDVILAAIQRSIIESCWLTTDSAGAKLGRVEVSSLAAIRGLALSGYFGSTGHTSMLVNIRQDATDINIIRSSMPLFGRSILVGVETLTEAISRSLDIDFEQALDLLPQLPVFGIAPRNEIQGHAAQVARTIFSDITDELERSLEYFQSQGNEVNLDKIIITGQGCMVPQIDNYISNRIGRKVLLGNSMRDMVFDKSVIVDRMQPILSGLIGSALEPTWSPNYTVDLDLNREGRLPLLFDDRKTQVMPETEQIGSYFKPLFTAGSIAFVLCLGALIYLMNFEKPAIQAELDKVNKEVTDAQTSLKQMTKVKNDNAMLAARYEVFNFLINKTRRLSRYFDTVSQNIPTSVQLHEVSFNKSNMNIAGLADNYGDVSKFAANLDSSAVIQSAEINYATRNEKQPDTIDFSLTVNAIQDGRTTISTSTTKTTEVQR
ncbi:MAG: type IV pilus assembly protein PilM [Candidatus Melainabacteria bacterium]|nr:type IV pilus assembly protein PilM [Candidatus Melainabacteria bacterium]